MYDLQCCVIYATVENNYENAIFRPIQRTYRFLYKSIFEKVLLQRTVITIKLVVDSSCWLKTYLCLLARTSEEYKDK